MNYASGTAYTRTYSAHRDFPRADYENGLVDRQRIWAELDIFLRYGADQRELVEEMRGRAFLLNSGTVRLEVDVPIEDRTGAHRPASPRELAKEKT